MSAYNFNLAAPPGFRGLDPNLPIAVYQRHLPHWRQQGATYFVTFRLADAIPQSKLRFLQRLRADWERTHPPPRTEQDWEQYARQYATCIERWLDAGYGECHFRDRRWIDDLKERLLHFQSVRYFVSCWAIMPNHCHLLIKPESQHNLESLIGAMKGVTARHINAAIDSTSPVWEQECYDRIVRDEEHLWRVIQYIGRNPKLAGLEDEATWRRWIHPEWEALGWRFLDE